MLLREVILAQEIAVATLPLALQVLILPLVHQVAIQLQELNHLEAIQMILVVRAMSLHPLLTRIIQVEMGTLPIPTQITLMERSTIQTIRIMGLLIKITLMETVTLVIQIQATLMKILHIQRITDMGIDQEMMCHLLQTPAPKRPLLSPQPKTLLQLLQLRNPGPARRAVRAAIRTTIATNADQAIISPTVTVT